MCTQLIKSSFLTLLAYLSTCAIVGAAGVSYDFNSGLPGGTSVAGSTFWSANGGIGNSGAIKLTVNANDQNGGFAVPDFAGGNAVTNFRARFKLLIGGGTGRPADGISFNFASGISAASGGTWEEGNGSGVTVAFDTWDNAADLDIAFAAPHIQLKVGGAQVAIQAMDGIREGGRAPGGPILTNSAGGLISLETVPPSPATPDNFVDVLIDLFSDNTISVSFSNVVVFNHVATTYAPITGGTWAFGGRTGGANDNQWIDNLDIVANYTAGPVAITQSPQNQTVTETQTATFSVGVQGTPFYSYQWYSNNIAIAGATAASYTTPPTTAAMNGTAYKVSITGGEGSPVTSEDAILTVNSAVIAQTVANRFFTNRVYVTYNKAVNLNGTYTLNNGVTVGSVAYGSSHSEVVLGTSQLPPNTTMTLTITGVTGEDASALIPATTIRTFFTGVGVCTDFATLPANSAVSGNAYLSNGVVHLTDAINGQVGAWIYNYPAGIGVSNMHATFQAHVGNFTVGPQGADGMSFNLAPDIPTTAVCCGEGGFGTGLSVTIDTWNNTGDPNCVAPNCDPSINVKWKGVVVPGGHFYINPLIRTGFVNVDINLDSDGTVDVTYDNISIFSNLPLPNFSPIFDPKLGFFARTGGENDNHWIKDLCLTHDSVLGPLLITQEPADVSTYETFRATFEVVLSGTPPYTFQWYSNNVAIAGATGRTYTTPPLGLGANGALYKAVITSPINTVTTRDALLTVNSALFVQTVTPTSTTTVKVNYTKPVALGSGTYTFSGGVAESSRVYGANHSEVIITVNPAIARDTTYTLTIAGQTGEDLSPLVPDPTIRSFRFGFGAFCADFNDNLLPPRTSVIGEANLPPFVTNFVMHLTDVGQAGHQAAWGISNRTDGLPLDRVYAQFDLLLRSARPADGMAFNWGNNVLGAVGGEEGVGSGLIVCFDTWRNDAGGSDGPGFRIKWQGGTIASRIFPPDFTAESSTNIVKQRFVPVAIGLNESGVLNMYYDGRQIFTNVALPNYGPIANSAYSFTARVGGANEDAWVDNLCINNFTPGTLRFLVEPVNTTAIDTQPASFTSVVDGDPLYFYQWFTNGVPVAGAQGFSFTIPAVAPWMNGLQVRVQVTNNAGTVILSSNATLTVTLNPLVTGIFVCPPNKVIVEYTQPVSLDDGQYNFPSGPGAEAIRDYGVSHNQVVVTIDQPMADNTTYTLEMAGILAEGSGLSIFPNPTTRTFRSFVPTTTFTDNFTSYGYIPSNALPTSFGNNMAFIGHAYISNGVVTLTEPVNNQFGTLIATNINNNLPTDRFVIRYRAVLGGGSANPADGYSVNIANNLGIAHIGGGEEGGGNGLTVAFDNFDNGGGEAPAVDIKWNGALIRSTTNPSFPDTFKTPAQIAAITRTPDANTFFPVYIDLEPNGRLYVTYNGVTIYNGLQTPFGGGMTNAKVAIAGRTGGLNQAIRIDDLQINNYSTGAPTIISQPANVTVSEPSGLGAFPTATFKVDADGYPPFSYQWYSNNVLVAGQTNSSYTTPPVDRTESGSTFKVVVTACGVSVTSQNAVLTVNADNTLPVAYYAVVADGTYTNIIVMFSELLDAPSLTTVGNYGINGGKTIVKATSLNNVAAVLGISAPLNPADCNFVTVSGVKDQTTYNTVANTKLVINTKAPLPTQGASNMVVIEAEDFDANRSPGPLTTASFWRLSNVLSGFVGSGYMEATPDINAGSGDTAGTLGGASSLDYSVNFGAAGTYFITARGSTKNNGSANSFHLNVNNVSQGAASRAIGNAIANWGGDSVLIDKFGWVNHGNGVVATRATISIPTPGVYVLTVVMREDGFRLDRFFLTTDANAYVSITNFANASDPGPPVTPRPFETKTLGIVNNNPIPGAATITWAGAGWTLQGTAALSNNPAQTLWTDLPYTSPLTIPPGFFPGETNVIFRLICK